MLSLALILKINISFVNLCAGLEMKENEAYTAMPGNLLIAIILYFQPLLSSLNLALIMLKIYISFVNLCAGLEMRENEAYTAMPGNLLIASIILPTFTFIAKSST